MSHAVTHCGGKSHRAPSGMVFIDALLSVREEKGVRLSYDVSLRLYRKAREMDIQMETACPLAQVQHKVIIVLCA